MIDFNVYYTDEVGDVFVMQGTLSARYFTAINSFLYIHPNHDITMAEIHIYCDFIHEEIQGQIHNLAYVGWV